MIWQRVYTMLFETVIDTASGQRRNVALRHIKSGEIVLREPIEYYVNRKKTAWVETLINHELANNEAAFMDLMPQCHDQYTATNITVNISANVANTGKRGVKHDTTRCTQELALFYYKIVRNAFNVKIDGESYAAILYAGRLFNHSCVPNIKFRVVSCGQNGQGERSKVKKYAMEFYACRDIKAGDEMLDHYFDCDLPYRERYACSTTYYGFVCQCRKCVDRE